MPPKRQARFCLFFRVYLGVALLSLISAAPVRAANITNASSISSGWGTGTNSWSNSPVATPWDSVNGATNVAVINSGAGNFVVTNSGVWANGITLNPTYTTFYFSGGTITLSGSNPAITVSQSTGKLIFSKSFSFIQISMDVPPHEESMSPTGALISF